MLTNCLLQPRDGGKLITTTTNSKRQVYNGRKYKKGLFFPTLSVMYCLKGNPKETIKNDIEQT